MASPRSLASPIATRSACISGAIRTCHGRSLTWDRAAQSCGFALRSNSGRLVALDDAVTLEGRLREGLMAMHPEQASGYAVAFGENRANQRRRARRRGGARQGRNRVRGARAHRGLDHGRRVRLAAVSPPITPTAAPVADSVRASRLARVRQRQLSRSCSHAARLDRLLLAEPRAGCPLYGILPEPCPGCFSAPASG